MRNRTLSLSLSLMIGLAAVSGCGSDGKVAAVVNGGVITVKEVNDRLAGMNPSAQSLFVDRKGRLLDQMITEEVLLQEAGRRNLARDVEVRRLVKEAEKQILVGKLLDNLRRERQPSISESQTAQFYEAHPEDFKQPESWRVSHILVTEETAAKKALERIKGGETFAQVAGELSIDPSKSRGGDIGFFSKGQVIPEFEEAVLKLKTGEMSGVVKTSLGWHVIQLTEHKGAHQRPLEEVRDQIRQVLQNQQGQQTVQAAIQDLRSKARIKIRENFEPVPSQKPAS